MKSIQAVTILIMGFYHTINGNLVVSASLDGWNCGAGNALQNKTVYFTKENPMDVPRRFFFCVSSDDKMVPFQVLLDLKKDSMIGVIKEDSSWISLRWRWEDIAPVCKGTSFGCAGAWSTEIEVACAETGNVLAPYRFTDKETGDTFVIYMNFICQMPTIIVTNTMNDLSHFSVASPLWLYFSTQLFDFLGMPLGSLFKRRRVSILPRSGLWKLFALLCEIPPESMLWGTIGIGFLIVDGWMLFDAHQMTDEFGMAHSLMGILFIATSVLGCLSKTELFAKRIYNYTIPIIMPFIGVLFLVHKQFSYFELIMHRALAIGCFLCFFLWIAEKYYPRLKLMAIIISKCSAGILFCSSEFFSFTFRFKFQVMNFVIAVINVNLIYVTLICLIVWVLSKKYPHLLRNEEHAFTKLEMEEFPEKSV